MNDTQGVVLGYLSAGPHTGGEICALAKAEVNYFFNVTRSQVYRELTQLYGAGQITKVGRVGTTGGKQRYRITAAGRKAFQRWVKQEGTVRVRDSVKVREHFRQLSV